MEGTQTLSVMRAEKLEPQSSKTTIVDEAFLPKASLRFFAIQMSMTAL